VTLAGHRLRYWQVVDLGLHPRPRPVNNLDNFACPVVTHRLLVCHQLTFGSKSHFNWYIMCWCAIKKLLSHSPVANGGTGEARSHATPLNPSAHPPPLEEEVVQRPCPLIDWLSDFFTKNWAFYGLFCGLQNALKCFGTPDPTRAAPDSSRCSPTLLTQGWTEGESRGHPPKPGIKKLKLSCRVTYIDVLSVAVINNHKTARKYSSFAPFQAYHDTKKCSASGGPDQGLCPWTLLRALPPDPSCRLVLISRMNVFYW